MNNEETKLEEFETHRTYRMQKGQMETASKKHKYLGKWMAEHGAAMDSENTNIAKSCKRSVNA